MKAGQSHPIKPPPRDAAYPAPRTVPRNTAPAKPAAPPPPKVAVLVYHTLIVAAVLLALLIAAGTIYALVFRNGAEPLYSIPAMPATASPTQAPLTETQVFQLQEHVFTGVGRLRAVSVDKPPVTIVVSIAFPYQPEDSALAEEITAKVPEFRNTALEYFSTHSAVELRQSGEAAIKTELLRRYNNLLHLGSISVLYFNDFMFID
ncbi:MAG: flagellar basal body-associated FliL family protein [Treponema sp.]|jgi:flagellar basal body-associated protein FliL|nr:flagellar basal body-associated FliL family protein [Treponema sp.]